MTKTYFLFFSEKINLHHIALFSHLPPPPSYTRKGLHLRCYAAKAFVIIRALIGCKNTKYCKINNNISTIFPQTTK